MNTGGIRTRFNLITLGLRPAGGNRVVMKFMCRSATLRTISRADGYAEAPMAGRRPEGWRPDIRIAVQFIAWSFHARPPSFNLLADMVVSDENFPGALPLSQST